MENEQRTQLVYNYKCDNGGYLRSADDYFPLQKRMDSGTYLEKQF